LVVFREPTPTVAIRAYETPSGNAPERMFSIVQCVLMELDPLGAEGARLAWSAG